MLLKLDELISITGGCGILSVFDTRYSDGLVVTLMDDYSRAKAIEDNFNGGDNDREIVRYMLADVLWFPMAFCQTIDQAVPTMHATLQTISLLYPNEDSDNWYITVTLMGEVIRRDQHRLLKAEDLTDISESRQILECILHGNVLR